MQLLLPSNLIHRADIAGMFGILEVEIILPLHLDDITIFDLIDNICFLQRVVRISDNQLFADNSIKRHLSIKVMIMVSVGSDIALICDFYNDLFCFNTFLIIDLVRCQIFIFIRLVTRSLVLNIGYFVIFGLSSGLSLPLDKPVSSEAES